MNMLDEDICSHFCSHWFMASVWKRDNSPYWVACYTGANGARLKKSTKQTNRTKALRLAMAWEDAARKARHGLLTENQARKVISEIVEVTSGEELEVFSVEDWFTLWLGDKKDVRAPRTHERYNAIVNAFLDSLHERKKVSIGYLNAKDIKKFRDLQLAAGKSPRTCNLEVKTLRAALNAARRQGLVTTNAAEALEMLPTEKSKKAVFTAEDIEKILEVASADWSGATLVGFFTGARLGDVANLTWESVDLSAKLINFVPEKTSHSEHPTKVVIPIAKTLLDYLMTLPSSDDPNAYLFPSLAGRNTGGHNGLSRQFLHILESAKLVSAARVKKKGEKGRIQSALSFHSLRHSCTSAMANGGIPVEVRQLITGHASAEMNAIYTHHELDRLRKAIDVVPVVRVPSR